MDLKYNPFRPNGLIHPKRFRGRNSELQEIEKILFQTKFGNPQHFLVEGERGIGKSSLMLYVEHVAQGLLPFATNPSLKANYLVIGLELTPSMQGFDILVALAKRIREIIDSYEQLKSTATKAWEFLSKWEILGVKYNSKDGRAEQPDTLSVLEKLCHTIAEFLESSAKIVDGLVILFDEADKPAVPAGFGELLKIFSEKMTRLGCERVLLGLAGLPTTLEKLKASHESSPRLFKVITLPQLSKEDTVAVVSSCLDEASEKSGVTTRIDDEAMELLFTLSEGYPHFLQQFGYSAFDVDTDNVISTTDIQKGAYDKGGGLEQLGRKFFQDLFFAQIGSEDYRKVLRFMAEHSDTWVSRADIIKKGKMREHTVDNALAALKAKEIITLNEHEKGLYRLPTKSFAAWIRAVSHAPAEIAKI